MKEERRHNEQLQMTKTGADLNDEGSDSCGTHLAVGERRFSAVPARAMRDDQRLAI